MKVIIFKYIILFYSISCFFFFMNLQGQTDQDTTAIKNSDFIVAGEIMEKNVSWDDDKTLIYTSVKLSITEIIKGDLQKKNEIEIVLPGGRLENYIYKYFGTPKFTLGEKVIVFLVPLSKRRMFQDSIPRPRFENCFRPARVFKNKYNIVNGKVVDNGKSVNEFIEELKTIVEEINDEKDS